MDIGGFLEARLAETEAAAKAATKACGFDEWEAVGARGEDSAALRSWVVVEVVNPRVKRDARSVMRHIAAHDPAFALADVAAKRLIIAGHPSYTASSGTLCGTCVTDDSSSFEPSPAVWPCLTLLALAQPYAGHADWDEAWTLGGLSRPAAP